MSVDAWRIQELRQKRVKVLVRSRELARRIPKLRYSDFRLLLREVRKTDMARD